MGAWDDKRRRLGPNGSGLLFLCPCGKKNGDGTLYSCKLEGEPTGKLGSKRKEFINNLKIYEYEVV